MFRSSPQRSIFPASSTNEHAAHTTSVHEILSQALMALSSSTMETNPTLVLERRRWMREVLADR